MKLDEALKHRWAGRDIKRKIWNVTLEHVIQTADGDISLNILSQHDIDADDWEVVPVYVSWKEAIEAVISGKTITAESLSGRIRIKFDPYTQTFRYKEDDRWVYFSCSIPLSWVFSNKFEVEE